MEHRVKHHGHVVMSFVISDDVIESASEHDNEIYHIDRDDKDRLIQVLGEVAMGVGGREGALAVEEVLRLAPQTEVALILVKKYIVDSGDDHKEFVERQILRLTEEITDLQNSIGSRDVDWGV